MADESRGRGVAGGNPQQRLSDDLRAWVGVSDSEPDYPSPWVRVFVFGLFTLVAAILVVTVLVALGGCAFSPFPDRGGGVLGIPIGEDGTVAPGLGGDMLTTLLVAGGAAVGVPGVGGIALLINRFMRAITDRAELKGREEGWTEREMAASVQAPLPGPVAYGGGGAGPDRSGVSVTETVVKT